MSLIASLFTSLLLASSAYSEDLSDTGPKSAEFDVDEVTGEPQSKKRKAQACFVCPHSQMGFTTSTGISNHFRARPSHQPEASQTKPLHRRKTTTYKERHKIATELQEARSRGVPGAAADIALKYGINPSTLRNWSEFTNTIPPHSRPHAHTQERTESPV